MIKRVKRTVRQSAVSHPVQHHSPLNSSCHIVSSAPLRTGQVREITATLKDLPKLFVKSFWRVGFWWTRVSQGCHCWFSFLLKKEVMARAERWLRNFLQLIVKISRESSNRMQKIPNLCISLVFIEHIISIQLDHEHHILSYFTATFNYIVLLHIGFFFHRM